MISDADFDDVFPWMARDRKRKAEPTRLTIGAAEFCTARWEDDGGRAPTEVSEPPPAQPPYDIRLAVPHDGSAGLVARGSHLAAKSEGRLGGIVRAA